MGETTTVRGCDVCGAPATFWVLSGGGTDSALCGSHSPWQIPEDANDQIAALTRKVETLRAQQAVLESTLAEISVLAYEAAAIIPHTAHTDDAFTRVRRIEQIVRTALSTSGDAADVVRDMVEALRALYTFPRVRDLLAPRDSLGSIEAKVEAALARWERLTGGKPIGA